MALEALTKSAINRSGKRLAKLRRAVIAGERRLDELTQERRDQVVADIRRVEAYRSDHAYPLRMANANLRYYVREYGEVSVTQRLKKFATILDKLHRQPTMQLATMEDIGGVRAVLPNQDAADAVARKLRKNWTIHRYRDYVREPKESGYRAMHLIAVKKGVFIESQIRTCSRTYGPTRWSTTRGLCAPTTNRVPGLARSMPITRS